MAGVGWGMLLLGESLSQTALIAVAFILVGLVLVTPKPDTTEEARHYRDCNQAFVYNVRRTPFGFNTRARRLLNLMRQFETDQISAQSTARL